METFEELVEAVLAGKPVGELKVLAATIAHHRAVSLLRERFAKKRGAAKTESLEPVQAESGADCPDPAADSPVAALEQKELAERLSRTLSELKPHQARPRSSGLRAGLARRGASSTTSM